MSDNSKKILNLLAMNAGMNPVWNSKATPFLRRSSGTQSPSSERSTSVAERTSAKSGTTSSVMSFAQRARMRALAREASPSPSPKPAGDSWTIVRRTQSRAPTLLKPKGYDKSEEGMSNQERIAAQAGRTRLCKHFLLGKCGAGDKCTYAHDISVLKPDEQKVFIGGIPSACTSRQLVAAIEKLGFKVLNIPKCHPSGFSPKVCLGSVEEAKELLKIARIPVGDHTVDVRKFNDSRSKDQDNFCVTITGIPEGTSGYTLLQGLEKCGFPIDRSPVIDDGATVCLGCEMSTIEQCDALLAIESLPCMGTTLKFKEFKPYVKPVKANRRSPLR